MELTKKTAQVNHVLHLFSLMVMIFDEERKPAHTYKSFSRQASQTFPDASYFAQIPEDLTMIRDTEDEMQEDRWLRVMLRVEQLEDSQPLQDLPVHPPTIKILLSSH